MHYAYILDLTFDTAAQNAIDATREALLASGMGNPKLVGLFRPHVSLTVGVGVDVETSLAALEAYADSMAPLPLTFSYLGLFNPPRPIVYLGVTVTQSLLHLHRAFHQRFAPLMQEVWAYYTEGVWVPHCTLALDVESPDLPIVLSECQRIELPLIAHATAVTLVEVRHEQATALGAYPFVSAS